MVAGDDEEARKTVSALVHATGFRPLDCGGLKNVRIIELMGALRKRELLGLLLKNRAFSRFAQVRRLSCNWTRQAV